MTLAAPPAPPFPAGRGIPPPGTFARWVPLEPALTAGVRARREVEDAVRNWVVAVDADVAVLLTGELVANAVTHGAKDRLPRSGPAAVTLVISAQLGGLRVDVHDDSPGIPVVRDAAADEECGRGLLLVSSLADEWGYYRAPPGKAVFFTLTATRRRHL